jgi:hypothetical protein
VDSAALPMKSCLLIVSSHKIMRHDQPFKKAGVSPLLTAYITEWTMRIKVTRTDLLRVYSSLHFPLGISHTISPHRRPSSITWIDFVSWVAQPVNLLLLPLLSHQILPLRITLLSHGYARTRIRKGRGSKRRVIFDEPGCQGLHLDPRSLRGLEMQVWSRGRLV